MQYKVEYTPQAIKDLKKLDKSICALIFAWIEKNLLNCNNPFQHGKGLTANSCREWRYRIGNYRLIADIQKEKVIILILRIGHRSNIYK